MDVSLDQKVECNEPPICNIKQNHIVFAQNAKNPNCPTIYAKSVGIIPIG